MKLHPKTYSFHLQLQRKRHIGNDIVCVVFIEADNTPFCPSCIKSHFLHTFIVIRTIQRTRFKPTHYEVSDNNSPHLYALITSKVKTLINSFLYLQISVVTRDEVGAYKPYLWEQSVFVKGPMFRDWLLTKVGVTY